MPTIKIDLTSTVDAHFDFDNISKGKNEQIFDTFKTAVNGYAIKYTPETDKNNGITLTRMLSTYSPRAAEYAKILELLIGNVENVANVINATDNQAVKEVYMRLCTEGWVRMTECNKLLQRNMEYVEVGNWNACAVPEFLFSQVTICPHNTYEPNFWWAQLTVNTAICSLHQQNIRKIGPALFGQETFEPHSTQTLPEGLTPVSFMDQILQDASVMNTAIATKKLLTPQGNITEKKLQTLANQLVEGDFPMPGGVNRRKLAAVAMADYAMSLNPDDLSTSINPFAKFIAKNFITSFCKPLLAAMLPEVHFPGTNFHFDRSIDTEPIEFVNNLLKNSAADAWLDLSNLMLMINYGYDEPTRNGCYDVPFINLANLNIYLLKSDSVALLRSDEPVNFYTHLTRPFYYRYVKMLVACGMLELALDPNDEAAFEGMRYVRLTPLGRYAFGLDKRFANPNEKTAAELFDIDDQNLIIAVLDSSAPQAKFLRECAENIGGSRYRLSFSAFMQGCTNEEQVMHRIKAFSELICPEPGPKMAEFLDTVDLRTQCTMAVDKRYTLLRINPEVPGLLDFLASSAYVKHYALKAQGHHLLIEEQRLHELRTLCLQHGFLI